MTSVATVLVHPRIPYNGDAFAAGLQTCGYSTRYSIQPPLPVEGDVLVLWNRHLGTPDSVASRYEKAGGRVVVAENGYLGREFLGSQWYAVSQSQHNGAGQWSCDGSERWNSFNVELMPWRKSGSEIVILAQRGMGNGITREPRDWPVDTWNSLRKRTSRKVRIRLHPGTTCRGRTLEEDLRDAFAVVTWGSSAALKAMIVGIPAFCAFPQWIGRSAAGWIDDNVELPTYGDRLAMFQRLAWAMWSLEEIRSGLPFRRLLQ